MSVKVLRVRANVIVRGSVSILKFFRVRGPCTRCCAEQQMVKGVMDLALRVKCPRCVDLRGTNSCPSHVRCASTPELAKSMRVAEEMME